MKPLVSAAKSGRRNFLLPSLLAVLLLLGVVAVVSWTAHGRQATRLRNASDAELRRLIAQNPGDRAAYYLGARLSASGQFEEALDILSKAADRNPGDAALWLAAAKASQKVSGGDGERNILQFFLKNNPHQKAVTLALTRSYLGELKIDEAEAALRPLLDKVASDPAVWRAFGDIAVARNDSAAAQSPMQKALALAPNDWRNQMGMGDALAVGRKDSEAIPYYRKATELAPEVGLPYLRLARSLLRAEPDPANAPVIQEALEKAAKYLPKEPTVALYEGINFFKQGRLIEARDSLERYRAMEPTSDTVYYQLAKVYGALGDKASKEKLLARHREIELWLHRKLALLAKIQTAEKAGKPETAWRLRWELAQGFMQNEEYLAALDQYLRLSENKSIPPDEQRKMMVARDALLRMPTIAALRYRKMPIEDVLKAGQERLTAKQWDEAASAFRVITERDAQNAAAWEGLGLALVGEGDEQNAAIALVNAVKKDTMRVEALHALGAIYRNNGEPEQARKAFDAVIKRRPDDAAAWHELGLTLRLSSRYKREAADAFGKAAALRPDNLAYLLDFAEAQTAANANKPAEATFRRALTLAPRSAEALSRFAGFLRIARRDAEGQTEAARLLQSALTLDPKDDFARYNLALLQLDRGETAGAIANLTAAAQQSPKAVEVWYALFRAYRQAGRMPEAKAAQAKADQLQRNYVAYTQAKEQIALQPNDPARNVKAARLALVQGEQNAALAYYETALRLDPKNGVALQGWRSLKQGR